MKSKRWKRRNRHTRPEWVYAWKEAEACNWYYNLWHYPMVNKDCIAIADPKGNKWMVLLFG